MVFSNTIFNLLARALATILHTPPIKLIGQKSLMSTPLVYYYKRNEGRIETYFKHTSSVKIMEDIRDVYFEHLPESFEETHSTTIRV
jgi:hypothetical protein